MAADFIGVTRTQFWTLNLVSLFLALIIGFEMISSNELDDARTSLQQAQVPLVQLQQVQPLARRMVQRIAQGSQRDPALKDLLAKYGLQPALGNSPTASTAPSSTP